jgi:hypothetical protein
MVKPTKQIKTDNVTLVSYIMPLCVNNVFSCHVLPCVCSTDILRGYGASAVMLFNLQFVDYGLVLSLVDIFGVKTYTWSVYLNSR